MKLGDKVEKVIKSVVPKKYIPKNCQCGNRKAWLNKFGDRFTPKDK
jgi:hypothetical protein